MNGCKPVSFLDIFRFQRSFFYPDGAVIRGRKFIRNFNSRIQFGCRYIASSVWGYKTGYRVCSRASGKLVLQSSSSPLECGEAYFSLFEVDFNSRSLARGSVMKMWQCTLMQIQAEIWKSKIQRHALLDSYVVVRFCSCGPAGNRRLRLLRPTVGFQQ